MPLIQDFPLTRLLENGEKVGNGCLLWKGSTSLNGYGYIGINKKNWRTHRLAYYLINDALPAPGYIVGHKCDVRRCCNPDHLEAITHDENMRQMAERGRAKKMGKPMIPVATRILIANSSKSISNLAKEYDLDTRTIERYRKRYRTPAT